MKIPKSFKLHGQEITVKYDEEITQKYDDTGQSYFRKNEIILQPLNGHNKAERIEQIFLHEMVHFILHEMNNYELRDNEVFVNLFSTILHQALETMDYE